MAQNVTFNINLKVDGKDVVRKVSMDVDELRRVTDAATSASRNLAAELVNFNQRAERIRNISESVSQLSDTLNSLTEESRSFGGAMAAANTMAGKSGEEFDRLKEKVADLSKTVPVARDELANGLYQVISNGVPEDNWIEFLEKSSKASVGGIADLGETVKVTSTMIKNYGLEWDAAGEIQDKIQLTAKNGVTSFEQMAQALPRVSSQASNLGVGIDELMASFATLTGVSGNTAEVSTQLAAIFTALIKPSSEAAEMAQQMGIEFDAASIKAAGGMSNFIQQLDKDVKSYAKSSGMLEQEIYGKLFGSAEALRALTPLTNQLADKFKENIGAMADSTGTVDNAFDTMASTGKAKLQLLNNKLGEVSDAIQSTFGNALPYLNVSSQVLMSVSAVAQLGVSMKSLGVSMNLVSVASAALSRARLSCVAVTRLLTASYHGEAVGATTAAVATRALQAAVRGLMIATGVGIAVWALTAAIGYLADKSDEASAKTDDLAEAEQRAQQSHRQEAEEISRVRAEMDLSITKLKNFKGSKDEEKKLVQEMNTTYGDALGYYSSVSQWYQALTANSEAYCNQMINEIRLRQLANEVVELEGKANDIKKDENGRTRMYSTEKKTKLVRAEKGDLGSYYVGGTLMKNVTLPSDKDKAQAALNAVNGQIKSKKRQMEKLVEEGNKTNFKHTAGYSPTAPTPTRTTGGKPTVKPHATTTTTDTKPDPVKGSIDYYEKEIEDLKKKISATADEGAATQLQGTLKEKEKALKDMKVRIGVEEAPKEEVKTALDELKDQLNAAQTEFDNAVTVEAKVKASAKVSDLQKQIDEATNGKLTIEAETEPAYIVKGSMADKRQSYSNAQAKANRIQTDYEIGLIGKDEARKQIADLNKELEGLGAGLKPIEIDVDAKGFTRQMDKIKKAWSGVEGIGNGVESITSALSGEKNAWEAVSGVVSGFIQVSEGVESVVEIVNQLVKASAAHTAVKTAEAAATGTSTTASAADAVGKAAEATAVLPVVAANKLATASFLELASASYFAAHASIPFVGFGIAAGFAASAAAVTEAMGALMFATGGIVPGNQTTGDKVAVRVNSGEMILNARQQARLFAIANGAAVYGSAIGVGTEWSTGMRTPDVHTDLERLRGLSVAAAPQTQETEWRIRGRDLVRVIANETRLSGKRSGIKI